MAAGSVEGDIGEAEITIDLLAVATVVVVVGYLAYQLLKVGNSVADSASTLWTSVADSASTLWTKVNDALHTEASGTTKPGGYDYVYGNDTVVDNGSNGAATQASLIYPTQPTSSFGGTNG